MTSSDIRMRYCGSCSSQRELVWCLDVASLLLMILTAFIGCFLPGRYIYHYSNWWRNKKGKQSGNGTQSLDWSGDREEHPGLAKIQKMLVRLVQSLELPANPLDQLTELCGGSKMVSEMTGRKGQLIRDASDGLVKYQHRRAEVRPLISHLSMASFY